MYNNYSATLSTLIGSVYTSASDILTLGTLGPSHIALAQYEGIVVRSYGGKVQKGLEGICNIQLNILID